MKLTIKSLLVSVMIVSVLCAMCLWAYRLGYQEGRNDEHRLIFRPDNAIKLYLEARHRAGIAADPKFTDAPDLPPVSMQPSLRILAWNIGGPADPEFITNQLKELGGYDIYGLSEVTNSELKKYALILGKDFQAFGQEYKVINGRSENDSHLQLIYNAFHLKLISSKELVFDEGTELNHVNNRPLLAHFETNEGVEFQVVLVHLTNDEDALHERQAFWLREWGRSQTLPTFAIGEFDFHFDVFRRKGDSQFKAFQRDSIWKWCRPSLGDKDWSDHEDDGVDARPKSMVEFAFATGPAKEWDVSCRVVSRDGDFPDDQSTSDHRSVEIVVNGNM